MSFLWIFLLLFGQRLKKKINFNLVIKQVKTKTLCCSILQCIHNNHLHRVEQSKCKTGKVKINAYRKVFTQSSRGRDLESK